MVGSEEEGEENVENFPENFIEWEKLHRFDKSHSTDPTLSNGCSLVVIRDHAFNQDHGIVFPPSNHENLHVSIPKSFLSPSYGHEHATTLSPPSLSSSSSLSLSSSSSSDCFSPSDDNSLPNTPVKSQRLLADVAKCGWWKLGLRALYAKVNGVVMYFRSSRFTRGVFLTFRSPVVLVAMLVAFLYFPWRRRRRQQPKLKLGEESNEHLLRLINEKDERINQLLNQIARMNEVLLALHRVPSSKTG